MVLSLTGICLGGALLVGVTHRLTKDIIAQGKMNAQTESMLVLLPEFDNNPSSERIDVEVDGENIGVFVGRKGSEIVGYAVESITRAGYSGVIRIMVGFDIGGYITNIVVLEQSETPGLGAKITEDGNPLKLSFVGNTPADLQMSVRRDGGDIDAITASTITSRAYTQAVDRAFRAFMVASGRSDSVPEGRTVDMDTVSGATSTSDAVSGATSSADAASGATEIGTGGISGATATNSSDTVSGATATNSKDTIGGASIGNGAKVKADTASGATSTTSPDSSDTEGRNKKRNKNRRR